MWAAEQYLFNFSILPSEFLKLPKNEQRVNAAFFIALSERREEAEKNGKFNNV